MTAEQIALFIAFQLSAGITPGPNNMLVMASGVNFSFRRTVPHILGIGFGFTLMVFVVGLGLGTMIERFPTISLVMKGISSVLMLWFAYKIATVSRMSKVKGEAKPFTFLQACGFQWVNPKAWAIAISITSVYLNISPFFYFDLTVILFITMLIGFFTASVWTVFGGILRAFLQNQKHLRIFNLLMAVLLVASFLPVALS